MKLDEPRIPLRFIRATCLLLHLGILSIHLSYVNEMYEIVIKKSVGPVKFGMSPTEVKSILGEELYYEDWMGGNLESFLYYRGILIGFRGEVDDKPKENSKVCMFQLRSSLKPVLFGLDLSGMTKTEIIEAFKSMHYKHKELNPLVITVPSIYIQLTFNEKELLEEVYVGDRHI